MEGNTRFTPEVRLDYDRPQRKGIGEVVYCPGKSDSQMLSIVESVRNKRVNMAFSRMSQSQADIVPDGDPPLIYDHVSKLGVIKCRGVENIGCVAVLSAGSSDVPIASEAAGIAEFHGCEVKKFFDVGVAGLHRLLGILPEIIGADAVIVAAGMDGALPSVVAGLVPGLVIGLPTSVGYGVASGGGAALNSMLSSCSPGLVVVNIDNGVGAGLSAAIVARKGHINLPTTL
jgi:NCAIR mutase (PurE)-related protein